MKKRSPEKAKKLTPRQWKRISSFLFLAPSLLGLLLFYLLPLFLVVRYSLSKNPISLEFVGLKNFFDLFVNTAFLQAMRNTLMFSGVAVPLGVLLSFLIALALEQKIPGRSRFRSILLSPMMVPTASIVLIWSVFFHQNGVVNSMIPLFSGLDWMKSDSGQVVVITLFLWKNLGYNMVLFLAALSNLPQDLQEVAQLEGAGPFWILFHIKLRYLAPTTLFVTVLSLINSFKVFREIYLLVGDYPFSALYLSQHFMNNLFKSLDYPHISSASLLMLLGVCAVIALLFYLVDRLGKDVDS